MYNETIYNVFINPQIQDKIFKKRNIFFTWLIISLVLGLSMVIILFLDLFGIIEDRQWINSLYFIVAVLIFVYGGYAYLYNPVKNHHISMQIYYYLLFLNYFYFNTREYPFGYRARLKYMIIVQCCIDSIDKFVKVMEEFLISGDNTSSKITYMRELRNLFYKVKRKDFFDNNMDDFKVILDDYFSSVQEGIISIFNMEKNIEYIDNIGLEVRTIACKNLIAKSSKNKKSINELYNIKSSDRRNRITIIIIVFITLIIFAANAFLPNEIGTKIINVLGIFGTVITIVTGIFPKNVK